MSTTYNRRTPCPKYGKRNGSPDGETYCPPCESQYQRELDRDDMLTDSNFGRWARNLNL